MTTHAYLLQPRDELTPPGPQALAPGHDITLTGPTARHLMTVKRTKPGERILLGHGDGTLATATLIDGTKDTARLKIDATRTHPPDAHPITVAQALAKGGRDELAVETCTELGAAAFIPWAAERSVVQWRADKADKGREKWENTARAAAQQSRRAQVPTIAPLHTTEDLARACHRFAHVYVLHEEATDHLEDLLGEHGRTGGADLPAGVLVVVGPEGGIPERETLRLQEAGAQLAGVADAVLRSSTAGAAAVTLLRSRWSVLRKSA